MSLNAIVRLQIRSTVRFVRAELPLPTGQGKTVTNPKTHHIAPRIKIRVRNESEIREEKRTNHACCRLRRLATAGTTLVKDRKGTTESRPIVVQSSWCYSSDIIDTPLLFPLQCASCFRVYPANSAGSQTTRSLLVSTRKK